MAGKSKWHILEIIGKPYALNILEALHEGPKRYSDLSNACLIDKTRTKRLKELRKVKLIELTQKSIKHRIFLHYKLTAKGEEIIKSLKSLF